ncbi:MULTISPECIES: hypothetical protein [unclassified Streptomyces]|uniref:hypothetical protein n=1 Tax=unclassified Streptomyces TaxID=2593676 RepID=UPI001E3447F4|nr:hypothetical protein [Streptomyces sp. CB02980]MCB8900991.1 hypothetical protein [Streptomyces sp. CB02980]
MGETPEGKPVPGAEPEGQQPMGVVKAAYMQVRGLMKESDGKALRNPSLRAEGRRMRDAGRAAREQRLPRPPG